MKSFKHNGEDVRIVKPLQIKTLINGKPPILSPVTDKEGTWYQVEVLSGTNKGNRRPISLKNP